MQELTPRNRLFDFNKITKPEQQSVSGFYSKYLDHHLQKISGIEDLLRVPNDNEVFFLQTEKAFNAFTFIPWLAQNYRIEQLYASSYSISRRVIEALQNLMHSGQIDEVILMISDSMIKRNAQTVENLQAVAAANPNFKIKFYWNHSKVCLVKTPDHHLILEGSGNWSENAQLEQYILTNSEDVFNFRKEIFNL